MRADARADDPELADLGVWNIYANPDYPEPQAQLQQLFCKAGEKCTPETVLSRTIALFKTPTMRDLADSDPYLHTGRMENMEEVLRYYQRMSSLARAGKVRNADPELGKIFIDKNDARALEAFLRSLTEDYEAPLPLWKH